MPDCETETFFATSETFGGVKPLDPCNPSTARIPEELREPTGDLTPIDQPEIPDPIRVWNCAMGMSCSNKYPEDEDVLGDRNVAVDDNVTSESIQLTSYGIPQHILTFIALRVDLAAMARTIHSLCRDLVEIYEYNGEDREEHIAGIVELAKKDVKLILMTNAGIPEDAADAAAADFVAAQERQNRIAHRQMESELVCYWLNKKQTVTCDEVHDTVADPKPWATQADYDTAAPVAITSALTVRSEISQADADAKAKKMAVEALNCLFVNDYQQAECWEQFGYASKEEAIAAGYEEVKTDDGPSFTSQQPPRRNFADVGPGAVVSYESKEAANRQAKDIALSRLSCYYINDPVDLACALSYARFYGEDPSTVARHFADASSNIPGQDVYIPKATFISTVSTAAANEAAMSLAEPLLDCCYVSQAIVETCPRVVVVYEDGHFVVRDNPGAGDEYYIVPPSETASEVLSVSVPVGQYAECLTTTADKVSREKSEALQRKLDELSRNMARASLSCAYCNVEIPPSCIPDDVSRLIAQGYTLDGPVTIVSPTWVKERTEEGYTRVLKNPGTVLEAGYHYQLALPLPDVIALADGSYDDRSGWSVDATNGIPEEMYCGEIGEWDTIHRLAKTAAITTKDEGDETCRYENNATAFYCNEGEWDTENEDLNTVPGDTALAKFLNKRTLHPKFKYLRKTNRDKAPKILKDIRAGHYSPYPKVTYRGHEFQGVFDTPLIDPPCEECKGSETFHGGKADILRTYYAAAEPYQGLAPESYPTPGSYVMIPRGTITMTAAMLASTKDNYTLNKDGSKNYDNPFNNRTVAEAVESATRAMGMAMLDCFFVNHKAWTYCQAEGGEDETRADLATAEEWAITGPECPKNGQGAGGSCPYPPGSPVRGFQYEDGDEKNETVVIPRGMFKSYNSLEETYEQCKAFAQSITSCSFNMKVQVEELLFPCYYTCSTGLGDDIGIPYMMPPLRCSTTTFKYAGCDSSVITAPCCIPPWPCFWYNSEVEKECWPGFGKVKVPAGMFFSLDCHMCQEAAIKLAESLLHCDIGLCYKVREVTVECPEEFVPIHNWSAGRKVVFDTEIHMCGWSSKLEAEKGLTTLAKIIYGGCVPKHIYSARYCNETLYSEECTRSYKCRVKGSAQPKSTYGTIVMEEGTVCGYSSVKAANKAAIALMKSSSEYCYCSRDYTDISNDMEYKYLDAGQCVDAGYPALSKDFDGQYIMWRQGSVDRGQIAMTVEVYMNEDGTPTESSLAEAQAMVNNAADDLAKAMTDCVATSAAPSTFCNEAIYSEVCDAYPCSVGNPAPINHVTVVIPEGTVCEYPSQEAANDAARAMARTSAYCYCNETYTTVSNNIEYAYDTAEKCVAAGYPERPKPYILARGGKVEKGAVSMVALVSVESDGKTINSASLQAAQDAVNAAADDEAKAATVCYYSFSAYSAYSSVNVTDSGPA